jgi:hypothetical protein
MEVPNILSPPQTDSEAECDISSTDLMIEDWIWPILSREAGNNEIEFPNLFGSQDSASSQSVSLQQKASQEKRQRDEKDIQIHQQDIIEKAFTDGREETCLISEDKTDSFDICNSPTTSAYSEDSSVVVVKRGRGRKRKCEEDEEFSPADDLNKRSKNARAAARYRKKKGEEAKKAKEELKIASDEHRQIVETYNKILTTRNLYLELFYEQLQKSALKFSLPLWVSHRFNKN